MAVSFFCNNKWRHIIEHEDRPDFDKRFNDPFYQNNSHIRCLRKLLRLDESIPMYSMVVFADKTDISEVTYDFPLRTVVQGKSGVVEMITNIEKSQKHILTKEQIEQYAQMLDSYEPKTEQQRLENVKRIKEQKR